jgi:hypothetical protein
LAAALQQSGGKLALIGLTLVLDGPEAIRPSFWSALPSLSGLSIDDKKQVLDRQQLHDYIQGHGRASMDLHITLYPRDRDQRGEFYSREGELGSISAAQRRALGQEYGGLRVYVTVMDALEQESEDNGWYVWVVKLVHPGGYGTYIAFSKDYVYMDEGGEAGPHGSWRGFMGLDDYR